MIAGLCTGCLCVEGKYSNGAKLLYMLWSSLARGGYTTVFTWIGLHHGLKPFLTKCSLVHITKAYKTDHIFILEHSSCALNVIHENLWVPAVVDWMAWSLQMWNFLQCKSPFWSLFALESDLDLKAIALKAFRLWQQQRLLTYWCQHNLYWHSFQWWIATSDEVSVGISCCMLSRVSDMQDNMRTLTS